MPKRTRSPSPQETIPIKRAQIAAISRQVVQQNRTLRSHEPIRAALAVQPLSSSTSAGSEVDVEMQDAQDADSISEPGRADRSLDGAGLLKGPLMKDKLRRDLKLRALRTPRFLFRAWRFNEDTRVTETVDSITPTAFRHAEWPQSMFDVPKRTLANNALDHLRGRPTAGLFSDWTHSLHAALEKAHELTAEATTGTFGTHICVIDTKRLPEFITILHTSALGLIDKRIPRLRVVKHKFLAYGVIKGLAYSAVPFETLLGTHSSVRNWLNCSLDELSDVRMEVKLSKRFGQLFGEHFELPVAAMLLAGYKHNGDFRKDEKRRDYILKALGTYDVPAE